MSWFRRWLGSLDRSVLGFLLWACGFVAGFLARDLADDWWGVLVWVVWPFVILGWFVWRDRRPEVHR